MLKIAEIIRLSWNTYISKFLKYLPLVLLAFLFSFVGSGLSYYLVEITAITNVWGAIVSISLSAIVYLLTLGITILLIIYTNKFLDNKKVKFDCKEVLHLYWPFLWLGVLVGLITAGGFLLLIVPGIIFTVWYAFVMYIVVLEKKSGLEVLRQSRELSKGRFWAVFGRLIVPNIFWGIISYLVLAGMLNVIGLILGEAPAQPEQLGVGMNLIVLGLSGLVGAFFAPLYIIVGTIVYREVKK